MFHRTNVQVSNRAWVKGTPVHNTFLLGCTIKSYDASNFDLHLQTHLFELIRCTECSTLIHSNDYVKHLTQHNFNFMQWYVNNDLNLYFIH